MTNWLVNARRVLSSACHSDLTLAVPKDRPSRVPPFSQRAVASFATSSGATQVGTTIGARINLRRVR